jgi:hypothetical protein
MERATTGKRRKKISHFFSLSAKRLCAGTFSLPLPHPFTNEQKKWEERDTFCGAEYNCGSLLNAL